MDLSKTTTVQNQIIIDRNRKGGKDELMSQLTMRKNGSAIQIIERVVNHNKENSISGVNMDSNGLNSMKSLNAIDRKVGKDKMINQRKMMINNNNNCASNRNSNPAQQQYQYPQAQQQDNKMQQMKSRFKRIKSSYDQTHQTLIMGNNNSRDASKNLVMMNNNNKYGCANNGNAINNVISNSFTYCKEDNSNKSNTSHNNNDSMRFNETVRFGPTSQFQLIPNKSNNNNNQISFSCQNSLPTSYRNGDNLYQYPSPYNNQLDLKDKYRSLTKELQTFEHNELICLLVEEMECNEKNKQEIERNRMEIQNRETGRRQLLKEVELQKQQVQRLCQFIKQLQSQSSIAPNMKQPQSFQSTLPPNKLKQLEQLHSITAKQQEQLKSVNKQIQKQKIQIEKLKKQLQTKREQVEILLETEKKNLGIIEKLKKTNKIITNNNNNNNNNNTYLANNISSDSSSSNLSQLQQLQEQINTSNSQSNTQDNKTRSFSTIMKQQKCKQLIHPIDEKSLAMSHILHTVATDNNCNIDYKMKHDQLQQYMNEYIQSVNQTYTAYHRTLSQLRQMNCQLKQANEQLHNQITHSNKNATLTNQLNLNNQLNNQISKNLLLEQEVALMKSQSLKLTTCIANSKVVISQLEEEFSILKDQSVQLKQLLDSKAQQVQRLMNNHEQSSKQLNLLSASNQRLLNQNQELIKNMAELQSKALSNTEVQHQIRAIVEELTENKLKQQNVIEEQVIVINQIRKEVKQNQIQISQLKSQLSQTKNTLQAKSKELHKKQSELNFNKSQLTQLQHKLSLTASSNSVLQQTVCEMTQLITELLTQHKQLNQQQASQKQQLLEIMANVRAMEVAYQWECTHKQSLREMLALFWQRQAQINNQRLSNTYSNASSSIISRTNSTHQQIISRTKSQGSAMMINNLNHHQQQQHPEQLTSEQNYSKEQQSCQISFKKTSIITKQGSSSILFNPNNKLSHITSQIKSNSKATSWKNQSIEEPVIESSAISHKYYSSQVEEDFSNSNCDDSRDMNGNVLKVSKHINVNRQIVDVCINSKENLNKISGHKRTIVQQ